MAQTRTPITDADWQRSLRAMTPKTRCEYWQTQLAPDFVQILEQLPVIVGATVPNIGEICADLLEACCVRIRLPFFVDCPVNWKNTARNLQLKWGDINGSMPTYPIFKMTIDMAAAMSALSKPNEDRGQELGKQAKDAWTAILAGKGLETRALDSDNNPEDAICCALLAARDRAGLKLGPGVDLRKIARGMLGQWNLGSEHFSGISNDVWDAFLQMIDSEARVEAVATILERPDGAGEWFLQLNRDITGFADKGLNEVRMARHHAGNAIVTAAAAAAGNPH